MYNMHKVQIGTILELRVQSLAPCFVQEIQGIPLCVDLMIETKHGVFPYGSATGVGDPKFRFLVFNYVFPPPTTVQHFPFLKKYSSTALLKKYSSTS